MTLPAALRRAVEDAGFGGIAHDEPLGGGCISDTRRLRCTDGRSLVGKQNPRAPSDCFAAEAAGLRALAVDGAPRVPAVIAVGEHWILLEDLTPGQRRKDYWPCFGRQLARLHQTHGPHFGFSCDNYCGDTPQRNPACDDGHLFFAEHRLRFQAHLARERGRLDRDGVAAVERVCERLKDLVPDQPPSLLHGDLWSGNAHVAPDGGPALIDPAAYWGWAEAELGMTALFGGFPESFYAGYQDVRPLASGWRERLPIYKLYHLLNHLNIFGGGYRAQALAICQRFAG